MLCVDIFTFHFPPQQVLLKISSSVPLLKFGNSPLYTFLNLMKEEFVKNDFQKAQIVTYYCYWTLFLMANRSIF